MNIVNSLKKLYTSLGGNADTVKDVQTAPDMVEALANIASSTIELPAVDAEDNGKVLKVANGKWGKGTDESLPPVTASDNGSVLSVVDGAWAKSFNLYDNGTNLSVTGGATEISIPIGDLKQDAIINLVLNVTAENGSLALQNAMGDNLATIFSGNLKPSTLTIVKIIKINSAKYLFTFGNDFYYFANSSSIYNAFKLKITGAAISNGTCTMYKR